MANNSSREVSNQLFSDMFEHIAIGLVICNTKGAFLNVNEPFCKLLGYSKSELFTMSFVDISHPDDLDHDLELVQQTLDGKIENFVIEKRYFRKDQSVIWVNLTVSLIRDQNNNPNLFFGTIEDISLRKKTELDLEQSRKDWKKIFQAINHPTALLDKQHRIIEINDAILEFSGLSREEIIGSPCFKVFHGPLVECPVHRCPMHALLKTKSIETYEMEMEAFNGTFLVSCTPIYNENGELKNVIHIATDITKQKETERSLQESEARYRTLLDTAPVGIAVHSEGIIQYVNQTALQLFGTSDSNHLIGQSIAKVVHPLALPFSIERIKRLINGEKGLYPAEDKYICSDGSIIDVQVYSSLIEYNGKPSVQVIIMDITEQKKNREKLIEWERRFTNILNSVNLLSVTLDLNANITFCNQYLLDLTNYTHEEVIGKNWFNLFISDDNYDEIQSVFIDSVRNGNLIPKYENDIITKYGERLTISWSNTILKDFNGMVIGGASIGTNVTEKRIAQQKLETSEAEYRALFEQASDGIFIADSTGKYLNVNSAGCEMMGYPLDEFTQLTISDIITDDEIERLPIEIEVLVRDGIHRSEWKFKRKDNSVFIGETVAKILEDGRLQAFVHDITNRKRAEKELQLSEEKFSTLFQSSPDAIMLTRLSDGLLVEVNDNVLNITGYTKEELIGKSTVELDFWCNPVERNAYVGLLLQNKRVTNFETSFRMKSGEIKIGMISGEIISFQNENHILGVIRDITSHKKASEVIRLSEEKFSKLFHSSPDAITLTKISDCLIADVNQSASEITGYAREELIGQPILSLKFWKNKNELFQYLQLLKKSARVRNFEAEFIMKSGEIKTGLVSGEVVQLQDERYVIGIIRDITLRKKAEQDLRKKNDEYLAINEELSETLNFLAKTNAELSIAKVKAEESEKLKSAFLANMSHEIRTPLNGILGFSELLVDPAFDQEQKEEMLALTLKSGENLLNIINDIIDLSKIESGQLVLNYTEFKAKEFLEEIKKTFSVKVKETNLKLSVLDNEACRNVILNTDYNRLKQILNNLVSNAIKYTEKGSIEIGIVCKKPNVEFFVKDTGIGIPQDRMEEIFNRFNRRDAFTKKIGGTGLGLAITKNLIGLLGGIITVESEENKGSCFYFTLPMKNSNSDKNI